MDVIDKDGKVVRRRMRRRCNNEEREGREVKTGNGKCEGALMEEEEMMGLQAGSELGKRECPVPKPGGVVGRLLGFQEGDRSTSISTSGVGGGGGGGGGMGGENR